MSLQSSRPRSEQSPKRSSRRMRCATSPRRYAAASHGRSSPRRRYERACMGARSSLGGLFQLMVLPKASAPARGSSSHQDRQLQPAPAPGSVVLRDPPPAIHGQVGAEFSGTTFLSKLQHQPADHIVCNLRSQSVRPALPPTIWLRVCLP